MGAWLKNKALELLTLGACAVTIGYLSVTFVSAKTYADDQKSIVQAIQQIVPSIRRELTVERLQRDIQVNDELSERLTRYMDADPESTLNQARRQEIVALGNRKQQLERELRIAMMNRNANSTL